MSAEPTITPDAAIYAGQLIDQAGRYIQAALQVPDDIEVLRAIVATSLLELAMLRAEVDTLKHRLGVDQ